LPHQTFKHLSINDFRIKGELQQFSGFYRRAVGDAQVSGEGG
jgi:hypothetical protein